MSEKDKNFCKPRTESNLVELWSKILSYANISPKYKASNGTIEHENICSSH